MNNNLEAPPAWSLAETRPGSGFPGFRLSAPKSSVAPVPSSPALLPGFSWLRHSPFQSLAQAGPPAITTIASSLQPGPSALLPSVSARPVRTPSPVLIIPVTGNKYKSQQTGNGRQCRCNISHCSSS